MSRKEDVLNRIVDAVLDCCSHVINGIPTVTKEQLLGKCRNENVVMSRCILVHQMISFGYSVSTIAQLLDRTPQGVRHLSEQMNTFLRCSKVFNIANAEVAIRCKDID